MPPVTPTPHAVEPAQWPDYGASVDTFIASRLPTWLTGPSTPALTALCMSLQTHCALQQQVAALLQPLQDIASFAMPLLKNALSDHLNVQVDPTRLRWKEVRLRLEGPPFTGTDIPPLLPYALEAPLMQRALQNFVESDAQPGGFFNGSGLFVEERRLGVEPDAFAALCRRLDVGALYRRQLEQVLAPPDTVARAQVDALLIDDLRATMEVAVHRSYLQGLLDPPGYAMLQQLIAGQQADYQQYPVRCRVLSVMGYTLQGAVAIEVGGDPLPGALSWPETGRARQVFVFLPNDPVQPLRQYPSWHAFVTALGQDLKSVVYRDWFAGLLGLDARQPFAVALAPLLQAPRPALETSTRAWAGELFGGLARMRIAQIMADAGALAVPTAQVDRDRHERRTKALESAGLTLLGVAASFVPGISQVMLATTVAQLLGEVFEGVSDWAHDQRAGALQHLLGVAQNVAAGVALSAGANAVVAAFKRSMLVDRLVPVVRSAGQYRLWDTDLAPYRYRAALPAQAQVRSDGLTEAQGRTWLRHDEQVYEVERVAGNWTLRHPRQAAAYRPLLEYNGETAWRLPGEHPQGWPDRLGMLRRLYPLAQGLSDDAVGTILQVAGIDADYLRGLHIENRKLPAGLNDTLVRFRLDARIDRFFEQLHQGVAVSDLDAELYRRSEGLLQGRTEGQTPASQRLLEQAPRLRGALFEQVVAQGEPLTNEYVNLLQRDFPGLPGVYALALVEPLTSAQREAMRFQARIPLAVAEQARLRLQEVRLNRALEGLCLHNTYNVGSATLAFGLLRRMQGWPAGLSLELREGSPSGRIIERQLPPSETRDTRILVRSNGAFRVYDQQTYELDEDVPAPAGLFEAISASLTDTQCQALGWQRANSVSQMRQALTYRALSNRTEASRLIGQVDPRRAFNPGQRLPDGRVGYPLSGRGGGSGGYFLEAAFALFPGADRQQIEAFLAELSTTRGSVMAALANYAEQWRTLEQTLDAWTISALGARRRARRSMADSLRRCWRRQADRVYDALGRVQGYRLFISWQRIGELPSLPAGVSFAHVTELMAEGNGLSQFPLAFLQHFSSVRLLNLNHNEFSEVPPALTQLPRLRHLSLSHNRINLRTTGTATLASLTRLHSLRLDGNPLGVMPDIGAFVRLREIRLRNTYLQALPSGLITCPLLQMADLRDNMIRQLPAAFFQAGARVNSATLLYANPLSQQIWEQLIAMDRSLRAQALDDAGAMVAPVSVAQGRQRWLAQVPPEQLARRTQQWDSLVAEQGASDFFELLAQLTETADFQRTRDDIERRVWQLIEAAVDSTALREQLFELAASPTTCVDSVASSFSTLEVRYLLFQARSRTTQQAPGVALLAFARRLFRLDQVEQFARNEMDNRALQGRGVDEVEVSLAYRVRLAATLDLPGQPRNMQFAEVAAVSPAQLQAAMAAVRTAEASEALAGFISTRDFWLEHLRATEGAAFSEVEERFWTRLEALTDQQHSLPEGDYLAQMNQLGREREQALQALALRLTQQALGPRQVA